LRVFVEVNAGLDRKLRYLIAKLNIGSYNSIVTRVLSFVFLSTMLFAATFPSRAQQSSQKQPPAAQQPPNETNPPEEDESVAPKKYPLDPLESDRNIKVGNFYWHKGDYRGALGRYEEASKYNPNSAEAFFKIGEAEMKLKNKDAAKLAFQRVIRLAPNSKLAEESKKKLGSKG
jgi:tetratricopeptide (TPR) repeat protein